jgi:cellulose synthase/poly-beta-1,6-N-acetylglucosamine synthase-like glycosyltransferase
METILSAPPPTLPEGLCVVIPAHNEELLLERCVRSVIAAGVAPRHVYVVDDGSTDGTSEAAATAAPVNVIRNSVPRGKLGAVRAAIDQQHLSARYRYVALLDADSHVAVDYFSEVVAAFLRDPQVVLVCGSPRSERQNWITSYRALEYALTLCVFRAGQDALGVITVAPGCCSTYAARILERLDWEGGTLVEDMDLTIQIHRQRLGRVAFTPHAVAYTQDPQTLPQYAGQLTRWYSGTWQVMLLRRLPFGGQRIDAEFAVLTAEGLIYALILLATPVLLWMQPGRVMTWLAIDQALWLFFALIVAIRARRLDIVVSFPLFPLLRVVNCVVLLRTFWLEVVRRKTRRAWYSVERYRSRLSGVPEIEVSRA